MSHRTQPNGSWAGRRLARSVVALLDRWEVSQSNQLQLLGLDAEEDAVISQYRSGERALPATLEANERVHYLLGIKHWLNLLLDEKDPLKWSWVHRPHNRYYDQTPLQVMLDEDVAGMRKVWLLLEEQAFAWSRYEAYSV